MRICQVLILSAVLLVPAGAFAARVDAVVSTSACNVDGNPCDGVSTLTRARVSAAANLYRSDSQAPRVTVQAWVWSFPPDLDPAGVLVPADGGGIPGSEVFAWADGGRRAEVLENTAVRCRELPVIETVPGVVSRWADSPDGTWRLAVEATVPGDRIALKPRVQRIVEAGDATETVVRNLPDLRLALGVSRLLPLAPVLPGETGGTFLEIQATHEWAGTPEGGRPRVSTGSWTDRITVGGQLEIQGTYTNNAEPRRDRR